MRGDRYTFKRWRGRGGMGVTDPGTVTRAYSISEHDAGPGAVNFRNCSVLATRGVRDVSIYQHESGGLALEFHGPQHNSKPQTLVIDKRHVRKFLVSCLEVFPDDLWDEG